MVPFSPDRTPNSTAGSPGGQSGGTSGFSAVTPERDGTPTAVPSLSRAGSSTPAVSPAAGGGSGGSDGNGASGGGAGGVLLGGASDTKQFCFSDDDESEAEKEVGDGDTASAAGSRTGSATRGVGSGSVQHRSRLNTDDESDDLSSGRVGGGGSEVGNRTLSPGGKRGVVGSTCATPAPGTWDAPDFGFSSDDDLDIDLSASERSSDRFLEQSLSKSPEIVKKTGE